MILLCTICSWHAFISIFDNLEAWYTFDGFIYLTEFEYKDYLNLNKLPYELSYYFDPALNQTMVKRSLLTSTERYDRYALFFFAASYFIWHIIFATWMYITVYKRKRSMKLKEQIWLYGQV